jgi:nitroreductase
MISAVTAKESFMLMDLIQKRFSVRGYEEKEVEESDIQYLFDCALLAPTAANRQPFRLYVVKNHETRMKLADSYQREWFREAPVHLVITGISEESWKRADGLDYLMCDISIVFDHIVLAATEKGLGTCWIAAFDEKIVRKALNLSDREVPYILSPLGYAKPNSTRPRKRKNSEEILIRI